MTAVQNLSSDDEIKDVENPIEDPSTEASAEDLSQLQQLQEDEHDGGYGWVCVVCQLMITASTWGVNGVSPPLFIKYILPYYETKTLTNLMTGFRCLPHSLHLHKRIPRHVRNRLLLHRWFISVPNPPHSPPRHARH